MAATHLCHMAVSLAELHLSSACLTVFTSLSLL